MDPLPRLAGKVQPNLVRKTSKMGCLYSQ